RAAAACGRSWWGRGCGRGAASCRRPRPCCRCSPCPAWLLAPLALPAPLRVVQVVDVVVRGAGPAARAAALRGGGNQRGWRGGRDPLAPPREPVLRVVGPHRPAAPTHAVTALGQRQLDRGDAVVLERGGVLLVVPRDGPGVPPDLVVLHRVVEQDRVGCVGDPGGPHEVRGVGGPVLALAAGGLAG